MDLNEFVTYLRIIRKRLWLILLMMAVTIAVIVAMVAAEPPTYRATVRLQVVTSDPLFSAVPSDEELINARNDFAEALDAPHVAWKTIGQLELAMDAIELLNHISVNMQDVFVTVNVDAQTPELAFRIAETHVNNALEDYRNERARPAVAFRAFLREQLKDEGQTLSEQTDKLLNFRISNNILKPDEEALAYQALIRDLELERDRAEVNAIRSEAVVKDFLAKAEEAARQADEAAARGADATANYYATLAQRYASDALTYEANGVASRAAVAHYDQIIAQKRAQLSNLIKLGNQYEELVSAVKREEANMAFLLAKENEARLREAQAKSVGFIEIIEPARYPDRQAASKLPRLVLLGGLVSLIAGIILAFLLEFIESIGQQATAQ